MSKRDRRKEKKQKRRQERIRQKKHQRRSEPVSFGTPTGTDGGWDDDEADRSVPADFWDLERVLRLAVWKAEQAGSGEADALLAFIQEQTGSNRWVGHYGEMIAADPVERAQDFAFQALGAADDQEGRALALKALDLDPDNLDALGLLLHHPPERPGMLRRLFRRRQQQDDVLKRCLQALDRRSRTKEFTEAIQQRAGTAWGQVRLRPYLRTVPMVISRLLLDVNVTTALPLAEAAHALDRKRNPAQVDTLVALYLAAQRLDDARHILDQDMTPDRPFEPWARACERFLAGDRTQARIHVERGRIESPEIEDAFLGAEIPDDNDEEIVRAAQCLGVALHGHDKLWSWFDDGCCLTTPTERATAQERYSGPIAALLTLGPVDTHQSRHRESVASCGLTAEHVPDLLRMADDQALHELEQDSPAVWAPVHAINALALLGPTGSLAKLLPLIERRIYDEWMGPRLSEVVAGYGGQALTAMTTWLTDGPQSTDQKSFAIEVLVGIAKANAEHYDHVTAVLVRLLGNHAFNPPRLNADLAGGLGSLRAIAAESLVKTCYAAGTIDESYAGSFAAWQEWVRETPAQADKRWAKLQRLLQHR